MTITATKTFLVSLYCGYNRLTEGFLLATDRRDLLDRDFYDERDHITDIMEGLGSGATCAGSSGATTTWEVREDHMPALLKQISEYNCKKEYQHIIHMEVY